jgi:DNA replication and repair protein RecF
MRISSLTLTSFRNYASLSLQLPADGALLCGLNGSGKTNLLEAIHVLCLGRSQRGATRTEMIQHGQDAGCVEGEFAGANLAVQTTARIGFSRDKRVSMSLGGQKVGSFGEWFGHAAVVSFGPYDLELVVGPPAHRRRFLDMLICQVDGGYLDHLAAYHKALQNRNRLLVERGDEALMEVLETQMSRHGSYLCAKRREIASFCQPLFASFYAKISGEKEAGSMAYRCSVPGENAGTSDWEIVFSNLLKNKRKQDVGVGFTTVGPHRDELVFQLDKKPARSFASQGQCRSLALSLRLSSVSCIEQLKKDTMIFLVDDAFSELDDARISYVYPLLRSRGQVFMATPSERTPVQVDLSRFRVEQGSVAVV